MFNVLSQPVRVAELFEIIAWRVMLHATRLLQRLSARWVPIVLPVVPMLWLPAVALLFGTLLGWAIVR
jgi:hypothetical protein